MFSEIVDVIKKYESFAIIPHISADGDALGSSYALKIMLNDMGKNAFVILDEKDYSSSLLKLTYGFETVTSNKSDVVISLDCSDRLRLGDRIRIFDNCPRTINIDHHPSNENFATYNYVDDKACATAEIIYELSQFMEYKPNQEFATNIYLGILTDTGGFAHSNTKPQTHSIASQLLSYGVNTAFIHGFLEQKTLRRLMVEKVILESLETYGNGRVCTVSLSKDKIESMELTEEEASGFVDIARSLDTCVVAVYFKETEDGTKVSLRSEFVDVGNMARLYGGGGHEKASGCLLGVGLAEAKSVIVKDAIRRIKLETRIR